MPTDREPMPPSPTPVKAAVASAASCGMQSWLAEGDCGCISAAEQLRDFTREVLCEEQDPERWDGLS